MTSLPGSRTSGVGRKLEIAFFSVGAALGMVLLLRQWMQVPYWFPFLVAGIASAWIGGRMAGWTAVILSTQVYNYFFIRPYYSFAIDPDELPYFIAFTLSMLAGNWFGAWRKNADGAMRRARDELASRVQAGGVELEKVSAALRTEVSQREQAEHERYVAELRWRAVFDNAVIGMALADEGGRIIAANQRYLKLIGLPGAERRSRELGEFMPEVERADFEAQLGGLLNGRRQRIEMEIQRQAANGGAVWLHLSVALVAGTPEFPRFVIAFCADTSERRRTEEALLTARSDLAHASRLTTIGELAASIAHELNQPLSAIVNNSNACRHWLDGATPNLAEVGNTLDWIMRDARRASDVIARIRNLMRKGEPRWEPIAFNDIVRESLEMMQGEFVRRKVEVSTRLEPRLPRIRGERIQLQQVLLNLILNAIEAMAAVDDRLRQLTIRTERQAGEDSGIVIEVSDTGPGIEPADLEKLFTAFFTTKAEGTGLGLWISQSIAESHSGQLLALRNPRHGMNFRLQLPCEPASAHDARSIAGEDFAA